MKANIHLAIIKAQKKGIIVKKSYITGFWSITLPNGNAYATKSTLDMIDYVNKY